MKLGSGDHLDAPSDSRALSLGDMYEAAWGEWAQGDGPLWVSTLGDGLLPEDWLPEKGDAPGDF